VQERCRTSEDFGPLLWADRAEVGDAVAVDVRLDLLAEVRAVLNDPADNEPAAGQRGDLDRIGGALVGMDPTEIHERVPAARIEGKLAGVDPVVHVRHVADARRSVRE
jgi:hypothetical protein